MGQSILCPNIHRNIEKDIYIYIEREGVFGETKREREGEKERERSRKIVQIITRLVCTDMASLENFEQTSSLGTMEPVDIMPETRHDTDQQISIRHPQKSYTMM